MMVLPYENVSSTIKFSPSAKPFVELSSPASKNFTYMVRFVRSALSEGYSKLSIDKILPVVSPLSLNPISSLRYKVTGVPKCSSSCPNFCLFCVCKPEGLGSYRAHGEMGLSAHC